MTALQEGTVENTVVVLEAYLACESAEVGATRFGLWDHPSCGTGSHLPFLGVSICYRVKPDYDSRIAGHIRVLEGKSSEAESS